MRKIAFLIAGILLAAFLLVFGLRLEMQLGDLGDGEKKEVEEEIDDSEGVKVLFVGDMMFDRWIRQMVQQKEIDFVFAGVDDVLKRNDLVVGNLEGPITNNDSVSVGTEFGSRENYIFTFPLRTGADLYAKNIRLVSLGNNHIFNFGKSGAEETKENLRGAGVEFFGDIGVSEDRFIIKKINGIEIAFLNYNQFAKNSKENVLSDLDAVKKMNPDFVVLYTHWGVEYEEKADDEIVDLAHEFVDGGVDLIVGSHPHVVQQKEVYHGKTIYYSLGNFVFDQYFDPRTMKGMIVEAEFDSDGGLGLKEYNVEMRSDGRTSLLLKL